MSPFTEARMHLGVDLRSAGSAFGVGLVRAPARRGLDYVALPEMASDPALDAVRIAPVVGGIGLIPAATVSGVAPAELASAVAALDLASGGRGGWEPTVASPELWPEAEQVIADVVAAAHPVVVLRADAHTDTDAALPLVGRWADVVRISAPDLDAAHDAVTRVRAAVAAADRDPDDVVVLLDVEVRLGGRRRATAPPATLRLDGSPQELAGLIGRALRLGVADGITLVPLDPATDVPRIADDLVPLLAGRGLFRPGRSGSLRTRFRLDRATTRAA